MNPTFSPVVGNPDYIVSSCGTVVSMKHGKFSIIAPYFRNDGYMSVKLCLDGVRYGRLVHHLVLEAFSGLREQGQQTRHLDGNKQNNNILNLVWGTAKENGEDRVVHKTAVGPALKGERNPKAKLNKDVVLEIRASTQTDTSWAKRLGMSQSSISAARTGVTWGHIKQGI